MAVPFPAVRIVAWLQSFGAAIERADVPAERADLIHAVYDRIIVAGPRFVNARLTTEAYQHGMALALATYEIPIEGRDEWLAAARRLA